MTVGINGISKFGTDRLRGVLATQSGWDTAPTNLAYATDGDVATATGTGVNNAVANGNCSAGYILFDMGA
ncbi:MAG: hypothetical protein MUP81_05370, partial [Dehalococcoidia bacterium]|nr:hypothetical protein [Dehalococcoidia bacterium]